MDNNQPLPIALKSLNNQIRRLLDRTAIVDNNENLTGMQYAILGFLGEQNEHESGDVYQKDVEAEFNIRRSTASSMLRILEQQGYIIRQSVENDARLKKITMTNKAKELDKKARENMKLMQSRMTEGICEKDLEKFYCVLEKISDNLKD